MQSSSKPSKPSKPSMLTLALGFVAGFLAVPIFHQGLFALLHAAGERCHIERFPWVHVDLRYANTPLF